MKDNISFSIEDNAKLNRKSLSGLYLQWLGQAGFYLEYSSVTILVDPYLSDILSVKYKGKKYPHVRMMSSPVDGKNLRNIDYYICTHSHSDHMDPGLIPLIAENNPDCLFIIPASASVPGRDRGIPDNRVIYMNDGRDIVLKNNIKIHGIASAHEDLEKDRSGNDMFLGYIFEFNDLTLYHSGDCVPYSGLTDKLSIYNIDLALLPVNGRSAELRQNGISGNFFFHETIDLMKKLQFPFMIIHHYGMFEFNTVDVCSLEKIIKDSNLRHRIFPSREGEIYQLEGVNG